MADFQDFITHNRAAFNQLLTFIDFAAERLTIAFVSVNFAPDRSAIIEALQAHPTCADIQLLVLDFGDREVQFLQQALLERLAGIERVPGKKRVLLLTGLEQSIGMSGDYPPLLRDLNFVRDGFGEKVPDPMVLFLPDYSITRLARFAPDFWAWELGVFKFETLPQRVTENYAYTLESERIWGSLDLGERRERVDLLQRLLMEYDPQGKPESVADRRARAAIYKELGVLYRDLGEVQRAEDAFTQGFGLTSRTEADLVKLRGLLLHEWGFLKADSGEVDQALKLYQESLEIQEEIGDLRNKAATLHQLAILKANQGDIQGAIELYQQSLQLKEQIGNIQGK
ncbi:MAG: tetratricopeptide repeat protein, partial [Prochlorothrix sp.]|nr:tetratricopeptide repeat protein [Prochlorothrix sp.]